LNLKAVLNVVGSVDLVAVVCHACQAAPPPEVPLSASFFAQQLHGCRVKGVGCRALSALNKSAAPPPEVLPLSASGCKF